MIVYVVDVLQDYNDHISELANKLVSIMDGVFDLSLSKVSVVSLTSTKRPNLLQKPCIVQTFQTACTFTCSRMYPSARSIHILYMYSISAY